MPGPSLGGLFPEESFHGFQGGFRDMVLHALGVPDGVGFWYPQ